MMTKPLTSILLFAPFTLAIACSDDSSPVAPSAGSPSVGGAAGTTPTTGKTTAGGGSNKTEPSPQNTGGATRTSESNLKAGAGGTSSNASTPSNPGGVAGQSVAVQGGSPSNSGGRDGTAGTQPNAAGATSAPQPVTKGGTSNGGAPNNAGGIAGRSYQVKGGNSSTTAGQGGTNVAGASPSGGTNSAGASHSGGSSSAGASPLGFVIRKPTTRTVSCDGTPETFDDADWICSFAYAGKTGVVYVQSNATSCRKILSSQPIYTTQLAQISLNGAVSDLKDATYDWGGNHHNDMLTFTYDGNTYDYYHSSFGFGWRSCQNMDCLQVSVGAKGSVTDDGCTSARTIPIVCSQIQSDGTYASLAQDTFKKCPGDSHS